MVKAKQLLRYECSCVCVCLSVCTDLEDVCERGVFCKRECEILPWKEPRAPAPK